MNKKLLIPLFLLLIFIPSVFAVITSGQFDGNQIIVNIDQGDSIGFEAYAYSGSSNVWGSVFLEHGESTYSYVFEEFDEADGNYYNTFTLSPDIYNNDCGTFDIYIQGYDMYQGEEFSYSFMIRAYVACPNHEPTFNGYIQGQTIDDGEEFVDITLTDYFSDEDEDDVLTFTADNVELDIEFNDGVATITYDNFIGGELVTFIACDLAGECAYSNPVYFTVNEVVTNTAPTFSGVISNQVIDDGEVFVDIVLTDYFSDADENDVLTFSADNDLFDIEFNDGIAIITYTEIGSECITFTACDLAGECVNSNVVTFTVNEVIPENNILNFENDFEDIEMYIGEEVQINLWANTVYTNANGNPLNLATLNYSIQDNTCNGIVYFEIDNEELTVSSSNVIDSCYFEIYVEETVYSNEMQVTNSNSISVNVIPEPQVFIDDINCLFDQVPANGIQACQINVLDNSVIPVAINGVTVELYYMGTNELIGTCVTENLGTCGVEDFEVSGTLGMYEVYAYAFLESYINDTDMDPTDIFEVVSNTYNIQDFFVYDDVSGFGTGNMVVDFFRGDDVYVEFTVYEDGTQLMTEMVSSVNLYDQTSGESIGMNLIDFDNGVYYYELDAIPLSDGFLGENLVFSYVLNNGNAGQASQPITIYNNVPVWDVIPAQNLDVEETIEIDLAGYAFDLEDGDDELIFDMVSYPTNLVNYTFDGSTLELTGLNAGNGAITVSVEDTEGDMVTTSFNVAVEDVPSQVIAYFDAPSRTHKGDVVIFDATGSQGDIVEYVWNFGDGSTSRKIAPNSEKIINNVQATRGLGNNNVNTNREIVEHIYGTIGYLTVTLTVYNVEGDSDTYSRVINVDARGACSDGLDNDGDNLIDMDDPGCQNSEGKTEFNFRSGLESGVVFDSITIWSDSGYDAHPGDNVYVNVKVANNAGEEAEDLRIALMSLDLGMKIKSYQFDLDNGDTKTVKMSFELPQDIREGEYPLRVSVANDDLIHSNYWFFYVEN